MASTEKIMFRGTGRRKSSIARIFWNRNIKSYSKTTISCYKYIRKI